MRWGLLQGVIKEQKKTSSKMQKQQISVSKQPKLFHSGAACEGRGCKVPFEEKNSNGVKESFL